MIASFKDIAEAMTRCVAIIEDYTRFSPSTLPTPSTITNLTAIPSATYAAAGEEEAVKKVRAKKEKKPKDPNAPKRPPSAYILFQNEVRDGMRKEHPELPYKDVLNLISDRWKTLGDVQKKVSGRPFIGACFDFVVGV